MRGAIPWQRQRPGRYSIPEWEIEGRATALVLLDLQVGHLEAARGAGPALRARFAEQAEYYYRRLREVALPAVLRLQAFFRERELPIVYCASGLALPDGRDVAPASWRAASRDVPTGIPCLLPPGHPDGELWPALEPRPNELILRKQTLSPFNGTALDQYLRNMGVENLVIAGVLTSAGVETTARNAGDRGYTAILVEDASAALSPEDHAAATAHASWYVVRSAQVVVDALDPLTRLAAGVRS